MSQSFDPSTSIDSSRVPEIPADALSDLLSLLGDALYAGRACVVNLSRATGSGRVPLESIPGDAFNPFSIGERWGPGRYVAALKVDSKYAKQAVFPVEAPAPAAAPAPASTPAPAAAHAAETATLMQILMQQNQTLLSALVNRPGDGITVKDLLPLLVRDKPADKLSDTIEALRALDGMRPPAGEGGESSDLAAIMGAIPALATLAQQAPAPQRPKPSAAAVEAHRAKALAAGKAAAPKPAAKPPAVPVPVDVPAKVPGLLDDVAAVENPALRAIAGAYVSKMSAAAAAGAVLAELDASGEVDAFATQIAGIPDAAVIDNVAANASILGTADARRFVGEVLGIVRADLADDGGDAGGDDDETGDDASPLGRIGE